MRASVTPTPLSHDGSGGPPHGATIPAGRSTLEFRVGTRPPVTLLYVELDSHLFVLPSFPSGDWFSGAVREGRAEIRWPDGTVVPNSVRLRVEAELTSRLRERIESKYGAGTWARYFVRASAALELTPSTGTSASGRLDQVRDEFDAVAEEYDTRVSAQPVERYLKDRVADLAVRALDGLDPILEIGPGTGYHTLPLLAAGHRVVAVDISEQMLRQLRAHVASRGWSGRLETRTGPASELETLLADLGDASIGGAFTAFGALDLEPELAGTARTLARVVRPGGVFALTSLNRPGWAPFIWELAMGRPGAAGARLGHTIRPNRIRFPLELHPRSPSDWDGTLGSSFVREFAGGVSVLAPPFETRRPIELLGRAGVEKIQRWDRWFSRQSSAWAASEWLFLTYRRRDPIDRTATESGPRHSPPTGRAPE